MRICIVKETNRIIEMQEHATKGTLLNNAIAAGYIDDDIEEKEVTVSEYSAALKIDPVEVAAQSTKEIAITTKKEEKLNAYKDIDNVREIEDLKTFIKTYIINKVY